jgi:hypothetical protein
LSNFTLNKNNKEDISDLTMSTSEFETFVRENHSDAEYTWEKNMLPKISDVVWRSLKALQET